MAKMVWYWNTMFNGGGVVIREMALFSLSYLFHTEISYNNKQSIVRELCHRVCVVIIFVISTSLGKKITLIKVFY